MGVQCGGEANGNGHDCNAATIHEERIVAIQAERIDRIKKSSGWKRGTIAYWTKTIGSPEFIGSVDCIGYCLDSLKLAPEDVCLVVVDDLGQKKLQKDEIRGCVGKHVKIKRISHHLAHAASAYYCSPFNDAIIVVVGGGGCPVDKY